MDKAEMVRRAMVADEARRTGMLAGPQAPWDRVEAAPSMGRQFMQDAAEALDREMLHGDVPVEQNTLLGLLSRAMERAHENLARARLISASLLSPPDEDAVGPAWGAGNSYSVEGHLHDLNSVLSETSRVLRYVESRLG